eukprot:CAMPEP_0172306510 /NCGR_PEP_ID=MMETSP1058-20130122/7563_1 /TAXON_ID=83371 /ORGANISM="Detonula confervacea, Strain CCMP 353" /LENGTH=361 /DNA_ID=CAMNT_0013018419 /DNA_START=162 /DNA_END=1247 /DNA_ORIENTATION=-
MFRLLAVSVLSNALLANAFSVSSYHETKLGWSSSKLSPPSSLRSTVRNDDDGSYSDEAAAVFCQQPTTTTRRQVLARTAASLLVGVSPVLGFSPQLSLAADNVGSANKGDDEGMVSQLQLGSLLKRVPTFAIVDPRGVPYFVVGEDAKLTSYFFLSYEEAKRILDVAIKSSDKAIVETKKEIKAKNGKLTKEDAEEIGINPWKTARITSVSMDLAVSLAAKGKLAGAYFKLAPSESDIEDALAADGTDDLPEGKVPLFYMDDMTISDRDEVVSPLYFQKEQLITEWQRQQKKNESDDKNASPTVKVTELFATLTEMLRPGGIDEELKTLQFVAPVDSKAKAERCRKGEKEPFRLGERLIVL